MYSKRRGHQATGCHRGLHESISYRHGLLSCDYFCLPVLAQMFLVNCKSDLRWSYRVKVEAWKMSYRPVVKLICPDPKHRGRLKPFCRSILRKCKDKSLLYRKSEQLCIPREEIHSHYLEMVCTKPLFLF